MKKLLSRNTRNALGRVQIKTLFVGLTILPICLLAGCKTAKVTGEHSFAATPSAKPTVIYVADFDLGAQDIKHQDGMLTGESRLPGGRVRSLLSGAPKDPDEPYIHLNLALRKEIDAPHAIHRVAPAADDPSFIPAWQQLNDPKCQI